MLCTASQAVQIRREPGHRIPEYILPTDPDNPALWNNTSGSLLTRAAANPGLYAKNDIPRTGTIEYPLVLVEFENRSFSIEDKQALVERYERIFNEQGYTDNTTYHHKGYSFQGATGSVSDYFRAQSYEQYTPKFNIIGPICLPHEYGYYGKGVQDNGGMVSQMVLDVCNYIITNNLANLSGYARNGKIDQLSIIYAGKGENYFGSDEDNIWPQASELYIHPVKHKTIYDSGITDKIRYACSCELFWDSDTILDGIGTFCHEFSHTLGLPDFYNTTSGTDSEANAAMGFWSLMDYGNYENLGFSPVGYTAFEKYSLGWMNLEEIRYDGYYKLNDISTKPDPAADIHSAYRLSTGDDNCFIILENHIKTGWYKYHACEGLMVTVVNYNEEEWFYNRLNNSTPKRYHILPADNDYSRNSGKGDLFPYQFNDSEGTHTIDSITTRGTPELSVDYKPTPLYPSLSIYSIVRDGNNIIFRAGYDLPSTVESTKEQEIKVNMSDGNLSVTAPIGSKVIIHDISGKAIFQTVTSTLEQLIPLPGHGIWIVKCGDKTRKVRF